MSHPDAQSSIAQFLLEDLSLRCNWAIWKMKERLVGKCLILMVRNQNCVKKCWFRHVESFWYICFFSGEAGWDVSVHENRLDGYMVRSSIGQVHHTLAINDISMIYYINDIRSIQIFIDHLIFFYRSSIQIFIDYQFHLLAIVFDRS